MGQGVTDWAEKVIGGRGGNTYFIVTRKGDFCDSKSDSLNILNNQNSVTRPVKYICPNSVETKTLISNANQLGS